MQSIPLKDIADFIRTGKTPPTKDIKYFNGEIQWFTPGDLDKDKFLEKSARTLTDEAFTDKKAARFPANTLLVACIGDIGKLGITTQESSSNQQITGIKPKDNVDVSYLFYWFRHNKALIQNTANNAVVPILNNKTLEQIKIPMPPLDEQQKIAEILDAADSLRQKDQQLVERYTALSQSLFLEMFGDPVTNPMGWKAVLLEEISDIASGVTKGRKLTSDEVIDIPYMRVANVQDGYLDLNEIKYIPGSKVDLEKYILKNGDLLLTEGGDPDKLGRGAVWNGEIKNCIHQNHIFRVRLTSQSHIPLYLSKLCGSEYGKRYFIKSGKQTTGIASINKTQLRRFPVLCPPIVLQNQFAERIQLIEAQKQQAQRSLEKSEALFNSLLQRAFTGELTA
jgi:type I restriction enzyme, S subunit